MKTVRYSKKEIASKLGRSIKTVTRLENKGLIKLHQTALGHKYCSPQEFKNIEAIYWGIKCPQVST